ncbi:cyclin-dependent kinase 8/11 [Monoraphidium neglectum]|uniref:Cyclin-dependent kinase 8/11 n=1 Tax=Monoraphidium neglectum TaxID=145388 RepID=A0A0D2NEU8_9CHLO|nr:cyclin-dependent kinase 8/11 [Monoraphidium neglectum]KIZ03681.1 cyclin-dependent kinase 8/11 [Monoraphidium neglectum]|eukprot:XP_013902700.1 cyclin-dependent kinase 8/11 [Monoraphidium neglectum]
MYEMIWHHRDRLQAPMDPYTVKSLLWQLLNGLSFMHQNWIIHRDLKPSNVLVTGEGPEPGCVKIADFGLARVFQAPVRPLYDNGVVVTIWYRAPELLLGARHYTRALDMWAAGCIFAELMTLRPLFQGSERKQAGAPFQFDQIDRIFRVLGHPSSKTWPLLEHLPHWHDNTENVRAKRLEWGAPRLAEHLAEVLHAQAEAQRAHGRAEPAVFRPSPAGLDLLRRMLEIDPAQRITAEDALRHDYFTAEAPLPGPNALVCGGVQVASYPRRNRTQVPGPAAGTGAAAAGGAAATALAPSAAAAPVAVAGAYDGAGAPALLAASQPALPPQPHHAPLAMAQQYLPVAGAVSAALPMASTGVAAPLAFSGCIPSSLVAFTKTGVASAGIRMAAASGVVMV